MNSENKDEIRFKKLLSFFSIIIIFFVISIGLFFITSCQYIPQVADDLEKVLDNDAITIKCDKDCFQKQTDVEVSVKVTNKDKEIK